MGRKRVDKSGKRFGRLLALRPVEADAGGKARFLCRCDCGTEVVVDSGNLRESCDHNRSCGCVRREVLAKASAAYAPFRRVNLVGRRFGRLVVTAIAQPDARGRTSFVCRCDCGTDKVVASNALSTGTTRSCGCLGVESRRNRATTHGMTETAEHRCWAKMKSRCLNRSDRGFGNYGGRGIRVCDRWVNSFEAFYADMGPRPTPDHSLERVDVNGHYEPGNTVWTTRRAQSRNRRNNRMVTVDGVTRTLTEWCELVGLAYDTVRRRLDDGMSPDVALSKPVVRRVGDKRGRTGAYHAWVGMRSRCNCPTNKKWKDYGGRGIKVCPRWGSYAAFLADVGERPSPAHSLDRIDVNGDYEPGNVRWATRVEQANNTRQCVYIEHDGRNLTVAQWARETGLSKDLIYSRVRRGVPVDRLFEPKGCRMVSCR